MGIIEKIARFLIEKVTDDKKEIENSINTSHQNNIIQNFNTGVTYNEIRQIAEDVFENKMREKGNRDVP